MIPPVVLALPRPALLLAVAMSVLAGCAPGDTDRREPDIVTAAGDPTAAAPPVIAPEPAVDDGAIAAAAGDGDAAALIADVDRRIAGEEGYARRLGRDTLALYETFKAVSRDLYRANALDLGSHIASVERDEAGNAEFPARFDVVQCGGLAILDEERIDPLHEALQNRAAIFVQLEQDLAKAGYDPAIYAAALARTERRDLQLLADHAAAAPYLAGKDDAFTAVKLFKDVVEPARRQRQPNLPPIVADGGCGDGETEFPFAISPADGVASIIRVFSFEVCDKLRLDPWNRDRCRGWVSVRDGGTLPVSGSYRVQISWPDGRSYRGDFTTQAFADAAEVRPIRFIAPPRRPKETAE